MSVFVDRLDDEACTDRQRAEAFATLYERHRSDIVALCRRLVWNKDDAEAIAQEAFTRAWASIDRVTDVDLLLPWVVTTARHLCVDHRRWTVREARRRRLDIVDVAPPEPDVVVERREEQERAVRALRSLSEREQRVVLLREVEGWSYARIAQFEDVTIEAVRSSLKRARAALRRAYERGFGVLSALFPLRRGRLARTAEHASSFLPGLHLPEVVAALSLVVAGMGTTEAMRRRDMSVGALVDAASTALSPSPSSTVTTAPPRADSETGTSTPRRRTSTTAAAATPLPVWPHPLSGGDAPEDGAMTQFASTSDKGTIYTSGFVEGGCDVVTCPVLFRSNDRGWTWQRLPAIGYDGGELVVAPGDPSGSTLFSVTPTSVRVSEDGGVMFRLAASVGGVPAISPAFASGDPRILLGAPSTSWQYRHDTGAATPVTWGSSPASSRTFEFSPSYPADPRILEGTEDGVVSVCRPTGCSKPAVLDGITGSPRVRAAPSFTRTGLALAWHGDALFRTTDGGVTFRRLTLPAATPVSDVVFTDSGLVYLALHGVDSRDNHVGGLFVSRDDGDTWARLGDGTALNGGVMTITAPPGGILIVAPNRLVHGVMCSFDGGLSWIRRCYS